MFLLAVPYFLEKFIENQEESENLIMKSLQDNSLYNDDQSYIIHISINRDLQ